MFFKRKRITVFEHGVFSVDVDRSQNFIDTVGRYDVVNGDVVSYHFPSLDMTRAKNREVKILLVSFNKGMEDVEVMSEFSRRGLDFADFFELLSLGNQYPEIQKKINVLTLDFHSTWYEFYKPMDAYRHYPFLCVGNSHCGRGIGMFHSNEEITAGAFWFAAVSK